MTPMIKNVFLFSFVLLSIIPVQLFSQTKNCLPGGKDSVSSSFQVIYNKPNNGLPDSIHVKGKILSCCNG
ncbi:MAG: hypothetical protein ACXVP4_13815, partial [Bacteroidia bacterium]